MNHNEVVKKLEFSFSGEANIHTSILNFVVIKQDTVNKRKTRIIKDAETNLIIAVIIGPKHLEKKVIELLNKNNINYEVSDYLAEDFLNLIINHMKTFPFNKPKLVKEELCQ